MTQRIEFSEEMVGNGHPTKADTLNRFINLITAQGDMLYGTAAATAARLAKGAADALLGMNDGATARTYKPLKVTDAGDVYNVAWQDYFASATIVGWTTPSGVIFYKTIGNLVFVSFYLTGTSNATTISFTLPYTNAANDEVLAGILFGNDSGTGLTAPGVVNLGSSSAIVICYKGMGLTAWTNSGTKTVYGNIWYQATT